MCGIIGFLDKRGGHDRPVGRTLLAMLQALSCRGPDSAGVAWFGPPQPCWLVQVSLPDDVDQGREVVQKLEQTTSIGPEIRHEALGPYIRLELRVKGLSTAGHVERYIHEMYPGL